MAINPLQAPIDYTMDVKTPFEAGMQGYAFGRQMRQDQWAVEDRAAAQEKERQAQLQAEQQARIANAQAQFKARSVEEQNAMRLKLMQGWSALESNRPEIAATMLDDMEKTFRSSNKPNEADAVKTMKSLIEQSPNNAKQLFATLINQFGSGDDIKKLKEASNLSSDVIKSKAEAATALAESRTAMSNATGTGQPTTTSGIPKPADLKLGAGETWNTETGRVEIVPNTARFIDQSKKHGADYQAVKGVDFVTDIATKTIDKILDPKRRDSFNALFGLSTYVGSGYLPGEAQTINSELDTLKSQLKKQGLEIMRTGGSVGQMTVQEWPIVENLIGSINSKMRDEDAVDILREIQTRVGNIKTSAEDVYQTTWGDTQFYKPLVQQKGDGTAPTVGTVMDGYKFKGGDPADKNSWEKVQ